MMKSKSWNGNNGQEWRRDENQNGNGTNLRSETEADWSGGGESEIEEAVEKEFHSERGNGNVKLKATVEWRKKNWSGGGERVS
jgi:hypothetical protein